MQITVNDIDGNAVHTVAQGSAPEVRGAFAKAHPVQRLITRAIDHGTAQDTYELDGEQFTTRVIVDFEG